MVVVAAWCVHAHVHACSQCDRTWSVRHCARQGVVAVFGAPYQLFQYPKKGVTSWPGARRTLPKPASTRGTATLSRKERAPQQGAPLTQEGQKNKQIRAGPTAWGSPYMHACRIFPIWCYLECPTRAIWMSIILPARLYLEFTPALRMHELLFHDIGGTSCTSCFSSGAA